jgi:hypothetical protein
MSVPRVILCVCFINEPALLSNLPIRCVGANDLKPIGTNASQVEQHRNLSCSGENPVVHWSRSRKTVSKAEIEVADSLSVCTRLVVNESHPSSRRAYSLRVKNQTTISPRVLPHPPNLKCAMPTVNTCRLVLNRSTFPGSKFIPIVNLPFRYIVTYGKTLKPSFFATARSSSMEHCRRSTAMSMVTVCKFWHNPHF